MIKLRMFVAYRPIPTDFPTIKRAQVVAVHEDFKVSLAGYPARTFPMNCLKEVD